MKTHIILIGGGGHCKSCIDVIEQEAKYRIAGIVDIKEKLNQRLLEYEIIYTDDDLPKLSKSYQHFFVTIGHIKSPAKRIGYYQILKKLEVSLPVIISPLAYVSQHASIGEGTIIMHHAVVNAGAEVGKNCIINTRALIEHDVVIGDHCHISTGAIVNGGVYVGNKTFFGSSAVSREYVKIGENCIIGCNTSVVKDIPENSLLK
jgi:sugar O-acyltransferase (sialic acid O-acetyltransferase NeuD family)